MPRRVGYGYYGNRVETNDYKTNYEAHYNFFILLLYCFKYKNLLHFNTQKYNM